MFSDSLILAGGSGTRLWPASTSSLPKQFLPVNEKDTFFSLALKRSLEISQRVIVITGISHISHVISNTGNLSAAEKKRIIVIGEPSAKNTAAAILCAVIFSLLSGKDRNMIVLTSDHIITPLSSFKSDIELAESIASDNKLAVFGIKPLRPETGYGYIETKNVNNNIFDVINFHEKPDLKTAEKYLNNGNYFWNSGMFSFNIDFITEQFKSLSVNLYNCFKNLKTPVKTDFTNIKGIKVLSSWKGLKSSYNKAENISFDNAIAEKCKNLKMIKAGFNWTDIGNWEEYAVLKNDNKSHVFCSGNEECYVDSDIPVALTGVNDLIIVIRTGKNGNPACALITKKGQTHKVRNVVDEIKKAGRSDLL